MNESVSDTIPLLSIVVPTFNSARFIGEMLDSLDAQTFRDFEVIVSDGGSSDETLDIIRRYDLPGLKIDSRPDAGVPDALNRGFALTRGRILCWMNSDDVYVSRTVLAEVAAAFQNPDVDFAYGHTLLMDESGRITKELYVHIPRRGFETFGNNICTGSMFFERDLWDAFGAFSGRYRYAFDHEIKNFLESRSRKKYLVDCAISCLRQHNDTITSINYARILEENKEIFADRKEININLVKLERFISQYKQGIFFKSILSKFSSRYVGRNWRESF